MNASTTSLDPNNPSAAQIMKSLLKRAKRRFRGFPVAVIRFFGPNKDQATKISVAIFEQRNQAPISVQDYHLPDKEVREEAPILQVIKSEFKDNGVVSLLMENDILGCPHQPGQDYPVEGNCTQCSYWFDKPQNKQLKLELP